MQYAFLGPLVGAIARVIGGWISDKLGGAIVTFWTFILHDRALSSVCIQFAPSATSAGSFWGFFAMFMLLFMGTGVGNASTFRMIPMIFMTERQREAAGKGKARGGSRDCGRQ